jgi:hypothetical protein
MVDPTKGLGPIQNITGVKAQNSTQKSAEAKSAERAADTVEISAEALSLSQAEDAANKIRVVLGQNPDITLGLNPAILDQTV